MDSKLDDITFKVLTAAGGILTIENLANECGATLDDVVIDCVKYSHALEHTAHLYVNFRIIKPYGAINMDFSLDEGKDLTLYQKTIL